MRTLVVALGLLALMGCKNKLAGDITVDGKKFELSSCRSGQVYGFAGVELNGKDGTSIRLVQTPTGEANAVIKLPGQATGVELGKCGPFTVTQQNSTINDVKNVEGEATLDCTAGDHSIKGTVKFANCH